MERTCKKCGETKPIEEFCKSKECLFGYSHQCQKCRRLHYNKEIRQRYYETRKEEIRKIARLYKIRNRNWISKKQREYYTTHPILRKEKCNRRARDLQDCYLINHLCRDFRLTAKDIRQHPELIENYRQQIKIKRLLKSKKK